MKIKDEHFAYLKTEIDAVLAKYPNMADEYENGRFHNAHKTKDLQTRFCFDILFGAGISKWVCDTLYPYMTDEHLLTALKRICPKVTRKFA